MSQRSSSDRTYNLSVDDLNQELEQTQEQDLDQDQEMAITPPKTKEMKVAWNIIKTSINPCAFCFGFPLQILIIFDCSIAKPLHSLIILINASSVTFRYFFLLFLTFSTFLSVFQHLRLHITEPKKKRKNQEKHFVGDGLCLACPGASALLPCKRGLIITEIKL